MSMQCGAGAAIVFCVLLFYRLKYNEIGVGYVSVAAITVAGMFFSNYLGGELIVKHKIGIDP